jgi:hypothetical protein
MLTGKPTGKRPLGRPRHIWEDNITMNLKEICIYTRNLVDLAQDRNYWILVNVSLNLWVLLLPRKFHHTAYFSIVFS